MPISLIAAGVAAVGGVAAAKISSNAANKASRASQDATTQQINNANANRDYQYNLNAPTIQNGQNADSRIAALLGIGGDTAAAGQAFDAYRGSTGYDFRLNQGTGAINSNAYARGMGNSGATLKALTQYGQNIGSQEFGNYLGQLGGVSAGGANARSLVAGVGQNNVNTQAQALQTNATNQGNAAIAQGNNVNGAIGNLIQAGGYALESSYNQKNSPTQGGGGYQTPGYGNYPGLIATQIPGLFQIVGISARDRLQQSKGINALALFQSGQALAKQQQAEKALGTLAVDPNDNSAFARLAQYDPNRAVEFGQQRVKLQDAERARQLQQGLAQAYDPNTGQVNPVRARQAYVAGGDVAGAMKFDQSRVETRKVELEGALKQIETVNEMLSASVDQSSYDAARARAMSLNLDVSDAPAQFDPQWVRQRAYQALDAKERLAAELRQTEADRREADRDRDNARQDRVANNSISTSNARLNLSREARAEGRVRFKERDKDRAAIAAGGRGVRTDLDDLDY